MVDVVSGPGPASFDEDHMDEWSLWVLENGLFELPVSVKKGESVPVAPLGWRHGRCGTAPVELGSTTKVTTTWNLRGWKCHD